MQFSPDDKYLLTGGGDRCLRLINIKDRLEEHGWYEAEMQLMTVKFSPDMKYVAGAGFDNILRIYDLETKE